MLKRFLTTRRLRRWSVAGGVLAVIWLAVGVVVQQARGLRPSAETLVQAVEVVEQSSADASDVNAELDQIIRTVQRLAPKERMQPEVHEALLRSFSAMAPEQQIEFVDAILPMGLEQMVTAYRAMGEDQKRLSTELLYSEFSSRGWLAQDIDAPTFAELLEQNAEKFLNAPDAQTRLELLPEMQRVLHIMQAR